MGGLFSLAGLWINHSFDAALNMQVPLCMPGFFCTAFCMAVLNLEHLPSPALAITLVGAACCGRPDGDNLYCGSLSAAPSAVKPDD